ncbi:MAG TPA: hypothetical protein VNH65_14425 [Candidatus Acidoferrum sp.]|nr:hypothetical protein [Candidatus Acidoferrum sp.]
MRSSNSEPQPWHLVPVNPGSKASLGRFGITVISILAILVVGLFVVVLVP